MKTYGLEFGCSRCRFRLPAVENLWRRWLKRSRECVRRKDQRVEDKFILEREGNAIEVNTSLFLGYND